MCKGGFATCGHGEIDGYVNNWNEAVCRGWDANHDIQVCRKFSGCIRCYERSSFQPVGNVRGAITYTAGYTCKAEPEQLDAMKEAMDSLPDGIQTVEAFRKVANAYFRTRAASAQEIVWFCLGLPLVRKTRQVVTMQCGFPEERHRMMRSREKVAALGKDPDVEDIMCPSMVQYYEKRVVGDEDEDPVRKLSLASYAAWYHRPGGGAAAGDDAGEEDLDAEIPSREGSPEPSEPPQQLDQAFSEPPESAPAAADDSVDASPDGSVVDASPDVSRASSSAASHPGLRVDEVGESLPDSIQLNLGGRNPVTLFRRKRKSILRSFEPDFRKDPEGWAYRRLFLYKPFRKETEELSKEGLGEESFAAAYAAHRDSFAAEENQFEWFGNILANARDDEAMEARERQEAFLGGIGEQGDEDGSEETGPAVEHAVDAEDMNLDVLEGLFEEAEENGGPRAKDFEEAPKGLGFTSREDLVNEILYLKSKMNDDQKAAFEIVKDMVDEYEACDKSGRPYKGKPLLIHGQGGTGKSFILRLIQLHIHARLADDLSETTSAVIAPTGTAANNVSGGTCHAALRLPIQQAFHTRPAEISDLTDFLKSNICCCDDCQSQLKSQSMN